MSRIRHAEAWAEAYELIDRQLSPLGQRAIEALALSEGNVVLDIGCGAGQTLCQLAEIVGNGGRVIGIDVASRLPAIAAQRTCSLPNVTLIEADAQTVDFPSESVDAVYSRFGVMSFREPIAAFSNFRRMLKPRGQLSFVCWQSLRENELDHLPLSAAGFPDAVDASPYSFAGPTAVRHVLEAAGFKEIEIRAHSERVSSGNLDAMTDVLLKVGPLGKIIRETPALRERAETRLREALAGLGDPARVHLSASVWLVTAGAPPAVTSHCSDA